MDMNFFFFLLLANDSLRYSGLSVSSNKMDEKKEKKNKKKHGGLKCLSQDMRKKNMGRLPCSWKKNLKPWFLISNGLETDKSSQRTKIKTEPDCEETAKPCDPPQRPLVAITHRPPYHTFNTPSLILIGLAVALFTHYVVLIVNSWYLRRIKKGPKNMAAKVFSPWKQTLTPVMNHQTWIL